MVFVHSILHTVWVVVRAGLRLQHPQLPGGQHTRGTTGSSNRCDMHAALVSLCTAVHAVAYCCTAQPGICHTAKNHSPPTSATRQSYKEHSPLSFPPTPHADARLPTHCQHRRSRVRAHGDGRKPCYQLLLRMHRRAASAAVAGPAFPAAAMPRCAGGSTCAAAARSCSSRRLPACCDCCCGSCCCLGFCLQCQEALPQLLQLLRHRDAQRSLHDTKNMHSHVAGGCDSVRSTWRECKQTADLHAAPAPAQAHAALCHYTTIPCPAQPCAVANCC
jgi:hypothetical protein